jgi:RimJ/RimL family protein N-acetyltransferase
MLDVSKSKKGNNEWYWLRPLELDDIPVIAGWLEDIDDLVMFDRRVPVPLNTAAIEAEWRSDMEAREPRGSYWFKVVNDQAGTVGVAGLTQITYVHGNALMPMFIAKGARKRGIGLRTRALLLDLAFDQLRLARITSLHRADNIASSRLNEACAFKKEGCIRNGCYAGGQHVDQMVFGILAEEWRAHRDDLRARLPPNVVVSLGSKSGRTWSWPRLPQCEDPSGGEP